MVHALRGNGPFSRADVAVLSGLGDEAVALGGVRLALRWVEHILFDFVAVEPA